MKKFAQILIIALLLTGAGRVWAITAITENGPEQITIERLAYRSFGIGNISTENLRQSLSLNTGADRAAIQNEIVARSYGDEALANTLRTHYQQAWHDATYGGTTGPHGFDQDGNLYNRDTGKTFRPVEVPAANNLPECSLTELGNCVLLIFSWTGQILVWLFGRIVWVANELFDYSINLSVRDFGQYADMDGVAKAWRTARNLVNVSFIFVLLYVAIGTILRLDSVNGKKLLSKIIIAALLVNFSAFFTRIMIDASNVVANQFYTAAAGGEVTTFKAPDITSKLTGANSDAFLTMKSGFGNRPGEDNGWWNQFGSLLSSYFGQIVLMLVSSTVLFAGAFMFLARTIVLIFIIVLSPLAFLGFAIGGELGKIAGDWRKKLVNQLIFAPVYMLLIYLTIQVLSDVRGKVDPQAGPISTLIFFAIVNGMMIAALLAAKSLGVAGAAGATKLGGSLTGYGSKVIGRTAGGFAGGTARGLYGGIKQTFTGKDASGKVASRLQGLGMALSSPASGVAVGAKAGAKAVQTGGSFIRTATAMTKKPGQTINEGIADITGIKIMGATRDDEKEAAKRAKEEKEAESKLKSEANQEKAKQIAEKIDNKTIVSGSAEEKLAEDQLRKMPTKDIVKLDPDTMVKLGHMFSEGQMKAIEKNEDITADTVEKVTNAREQQIETLESTINSNRGSRGGAVTNTVQQTSLSLIAKMINELDNKDVNYNSTLETIADNLGLVKLDGLRNTREIKRDRLTLIRNRMATNGLTPLP